MSNINNILFVGKVRVHFSELNSTNLYALDLLSKNNPSEGTVITADKQLEGRGQIGRTWESEVGKNILASFILYPKFLLARKQFLLSQAVALAILALVKNNVDKNNVSMKWPNDIYIGSKKVAGILIQNQLSGANFRSSVIGIGININQTVFKTNPPNPTSFQLETGEIFDLETIHNQLCWYLEKSYLLLRNGKLDQIEKDYQSQLYLYQQKSLFQKPSGELFEGMIMGVNNIGKLLIKSSSGLEAFGLKEVKFVSKS